MRQTDFLRRLAEVVGVSSETVFHEMISFARNPPRGVFALSEKTIRDFRNRGVSLRNRATREFISQFTIHFLDRPHDLDNAQVQKLHAYLKDIGLDSAAEALPSHLMGVPAAKENFIRKINEIEMSSGASKRASEEIRGLYNLIRPLHGRENQEFVQEPIYIGAANEESWLLSRSVGLLKGFTVHGRGVSTLLLHRVNSFEGISLYVLKIAFGDHVSKEMSPGLMLYVPQDRRTPIASTIAIAHTKFRGDERQDLMRVAEVRDDDQIMTLSRKLSTVLSDDDELPKALKKFRFPQTSEVPSEAEWYEILDEI